MPKWFRWNQDEEGIHRVSSLEKRGRPYRAPLSRPVPDKPRQCLKPQAAVLTDLNRAVASLQVYVLSMG